MGDARERSAHLEGQRTGRILLIPIHLCYMERGAEVDRTSLQVANDAQIAAAGRFQRQVRATQVHVAPTPAGGSDVDAIRHGERGVRRRRSEVSTVGEGVETRRLIQEGRAIPIEDALIVEVHLHVDFAGTGEVQMTPTPDSVPDPVRFNTAPGPGIN